MLREVQGAKRGEEQLGRAILYLVAPRRAERGWLRQQRWTAACLGAVLREPNAVAESMQRSRALRIVWVLQRSMVRLNALRLSFITSLRYSVDETNVLIYFCDFSSLVYHVSSKYQRISLKDQDGIHQQQLIKEEKEAAGILSCHLIVKQKLNILNSFSLLE